ncbi:hypothetical protein [Nonomuraea salmonea]|uniref:hypothetical protein n=1 Tax=Nonomuraea salmonea TaxID=46181 RepID=UPI0031F0F0B6
MTSLPLAVVAVPNTLSVVAGLLPDDLDQAGLMRTHGLALPALMLAVPLAVALMRRVPAAPLLVGALALVALSDAAGGYAASELVVGVVRVLRGAGSGAVIAVTLAAAWHRAPVLRGLWAGVFALSLLTAQALALWPLDEVTSWRVTLQPYPLVTGIALALAAVHLVVWLVLGRPDGDPLENGELKRLLLAVAPVAVVAAAAVSTASAGWRSGAVVLLAALAVAGLLALASIGGAVRRVSAYTMVAVGVVLLPSAAQITLVEMGGLGGPGLRGLWVPYAVAGGARDRGRGGGAAARAGWPAVARAAGAARRGGRALFGTAGGAVGRRDGAGGAVHAACRGCGGRDHGGAAGRRARRGRLRADAVLHGSADRVPARRGRADGDAGRRTVAAGAGRRVRGSVALVGADQRVPGRGDHRAGFADGAAARQGACGAAGALCGAVRARRRAARQCAGRR